MSGNSIALDTSVAISILAGEASTLLAGRDSEPFLLPVPVIGELRYGALHSTRITENLAEVERLIARCRVLDIVAATAEVYAQLRLRLRQKGRPIPENDLWIAALCVQHGVALAAIDSHFDSIDDLIRHRL